MIGLIKNLFFIPTAIVEALFGYDFFISYAHKDPKKYTEKLDAALRADHTVHLDKRDYKLGQNIGVLTKIRIKNSSHLVVVAFPKALNESHWVRKEVESFQKRGKEPIIIDIDDAVAKSIQNPVKGTLGEWLDERRVLEADGTFSDPIIRETDSSGYCEEGERVPTTDVIQNIKESFRGARVETRRLQVVTAALVTLIVLSSLSLLLAFNFRSQSLIAENRASEIASNAALQLLEKGFVPEALENAKLAFTNGEQELRLVHPLAVTAALSVINAGSKGKSAKMTDHILDADIDDSGELMVTGHRDGHVRIWSVGNGALLHEKKLHKRIAFAVEFLPESNSILTGGLEKKLIHWNFEADTSHELTTSIGNIVDIISAQNSTNVAFLTSLNRIIVWDMERAVTIGEAFEGHVNFNYGDGSFGFNRDGNLIAGRTKDSVILFDVYKGKEICEVSLEGNNVVSLKFDPMSQNVVALADATNSKKPQPVLTFSIDENGVCGSFEKVDISRVTGAGNCGFGDIKEESIAWVDGMPWMLVLTKESFRVETLACVVLIDWLSGEIVAGRQLLNDGFVDQDKRNEIANLVFSNSVVSRNLDVFSYYRTLPGGEFYRQNWLQLDAEELMAKTVSASDLVLIESSKDSRYTVGVSRDLIAVTDYETGETTRLAVDLGEKGPSLPTAIFDKSNSYFAMSNGQSLSLFSLNPLSHIDTTAIADPTSERAIMDIEFQYEPISILALTTPTTLLEFEIMLEESEAGETSGRLIAKSEPTQSRHPLEKLVSGPADSIWAAGASGVLLELRSGGKEVTISGRLEYGEARQQRIYQLAGSTDGSIIAAGTSNLGIVVFSESLPSPICHLPDIYDIDGMQMNSDGRFLLVQSRLNELLLFDLTTCRKVSGWQFSSDPTAVFADFESEILVLVNGRQTRLELPTSLKGDGLESRLRSVLN